MPVDVRSYCLSILEGPSLEDKLRPPVATGGAPLADDHPGEPVHVDTPAREPALRMQSRPQPLPAAHDLADPRKRVECMERFAHHELMAVEMFAWALLVWPDMPRALRRGLLATLADEQRHMKMYVARVEALGCELGTNPQSAYLWKHAPAIRNHPRGVLAFLSAMGLTFEQANLDFTLHYAEAFRKAGDATSAAVMEQIHEDEIGHVRQAMEWLRRLKAPGVDDMAAYEQSVPFPLRAARAKGKRFDAVARRRAGLSEAMIEAVRVARPGDVTRPTARPSASSASTASTNDETVPQARTVLCPNLGGEEEDNRVHQRLRSTARLWALLFHPQTIIAWPDGSLERVAWPEVLGPRPDAAAYPWLEQADGVAWLPTARASGALSRLGREMRGASADLVRRVHDKAFSVDVARRHGMLPDDIEPLVRVLQPQDLRSEGGRRRLDEFLLQWPDRARQNYVFKPRFGCSGRGLSHGSGVPLTGPLEPALRRLAARGGAVLEPWLQRVDDFSVQMHVGSEGEIEILGSMRQIMARSGAVIGHRGSWSVDGQPVAGKEHDQAVAAAARIAAGEAARLGFHGPCGVDSFSYRGGDGQERLRSLVELNARFTTGHISLGILRRAAGLVEGARVWAFLAGDPPGGWRQSAEARVLPLVLAEADRSTGGLLLARNDHALDAALRAVAGTPDPEVGAAAGQQEH